MSGLVLLRGLLESVFWWIHMTLERALWAAGVETHHESRSEGEYQAAWDKHESSIYLLPHS